MSIFTISKLVISLITKAYRSVKSIKSWEEKRITITYVFVYWELSLFKTLRVVALWNKTNSLIRLYSNKVNVVCTYSIIKFCVCRFVCVCLGVCTCVYVWFNVHVWVLCILVFLAYHLIVTTKYIGAFLYSTAGMYSERFDHFFILRFHRISDYKELLLAFFRWYNVEVLFRGFMYTKA